MITLRSMRNLATLSSVALAVSGLMASFNYSATAEKQILGSLDTLSPELLLIRYHAGNVPFRRIEDDVQTVKRLFNGQGHAAPFVVTEFVLKNLLNETLWGYRVQTTPEAYTILHMEMQPLPQKTPLGVTLSNSNTCFLSEHLTPHVAGNRTAAGISIVLLGQTVFVKGAFTCKDKLLGIDWDKAILVPFSPFDWKGETSKMSLVVRVPGGVNKVVADKVEAALMRTRNSKDFSMANFQEVIEQKRKITKAIRLLTETISLVILLMASISCMNIFFISVSERTREIGLRRALGASRPEILFLIMKDSYLFMGIGTAIGLVGGYYFTHSLMRPLLLVMPEFAGWTFDTNSTATLKTLAFLGAGATISGFFPALRATKIDPALALRE